MRVCLRALLQYKALDAVLYVALLGNRDGSDPSAHLRNMNRFFFFASILFYPIILEGRRGTTDEFATIPLHQSLLYCRW